MSDEDAARGALFGDAPVRAAGKPNPYASGASSAPASKPSHAPTSSASSASSRATGQSAEDADRAALLAGGVRRPASSYAPSLATSTYNSSSLTGASAAPSVAAFASIPAPPPVEAPVELDDGDFDLEEDMKKIELLTQMTQQMTSGSAMRMHRARGGTTAFTTAAGAHLDDASGMGGAGELDFAAIDEDLARFAEDRVIAEALSKGVDLRLYARQVDADLRSMEMRSIADYVNEADAIAVLFEQITACEGVLGDMQGMLDTFQTSLGGISTEIRTLQEQSLGLSVSMGNRKALAGKISAFLSKVSVSEALVTRIVDAPVDEGWIAKELRELGDKLAFAHHGGASSSSASASSSSTVSGDFGVLSDLTISPFSTPVGRESQPQLDRLRIAACTKLRAYFMKAIGDAARTTGTNVARHQEVVLLKAAPAMAFLNTWGGPVGKEVRSAYADSMGRVYGDIMKTYGDRMGKLLVGVPGKGDTLVEYNQAARVAAAIAADPTLSGHPAPIVDPFRLTPDRLRVLDDAASPAVAAHQLASERVRLTFEQLWRHLVRHLMDVSCSEYVFDHSFFGHGASRSAAKAAAGEIFSLTLLPAINAVMGVLEAHCMAAWDAPGLLLLVALTSHHRRIMNLDLKCEALDPFFDRVTMVLWPRFKQVLDANKEAVKQASAQLAAGKRGVFTPAVEATSPHPLSRRYADFASSILRLHGALSHVHMSDDMLAHHMGALGREVDALWQRMAMDLPARVPRIAFMVHNYYLCLTVGRAMGVEEAALAAWHRAADGYMSQYVDAELETYFRSLGAFVRKTEAGVVHAARVAGIPLIDATAAPAPAPPTDPSAPLPVPSILELPASVPVSCVDPTEAASALQDFNRNWRPGLKGLHDDVQRYFAAHGSAAATAAVGGAGTGGGGGAAFGASPIAPPAGASLVLTLLGRVFSAFADYYGRFRALLTRGLPPTSPLLRELLPTDPIVFEIKKYSPEGR